MTPQLTANLQVISKRFPEVLEELKTQVFSQPSTDAVIGYLAKIYGEHPREALLQRWSAIVPTQPFQVIVTTGFGDGSHLLQLLEKLPDTSRLCVIEADVAMLLGLLDQRDCSDLLNDPRFILITPFCYREIITRLNLELIGIESARSFIYTPIFELHAGLYKNLIDTVMRQLTIRWNQLKTDITNADVIFQNSLANLAEHHMGADIGSLHGVFQGKPLVLVGAGPSLDESFEFLKAAQGKAVIAVVNSAYRAVMRQGILPDITVAVDPFEGTYRGYEGADTSHPLLVCAYQVFPEVTRHFKGRVFPLSSFNYLMTLLRKLLNLAPEDNIIGDGTVSTTVVNLAAYMGCSDIYLVGQDMAVSATGQIHTKDSFYTDRNENAIDTSSCEWLPGNHGELVPVEAKLHAYLKIFENQVSHYTHIRFHNLARYGSRIHGAPYLDPAEAEQQMHLLDQFPFHETLIQKAEAARLPDPVFEAARYFFGKYHSFLEELTPAMMEFAVATELAIAAENNTVDNPVLLEKQSRVLQIIESNPLFTTILNEGRTKQEYRDFITQNERWKLISDPHATPEELMPQVWAMIEGATFQMQQIQNTLL